MSLLLPSHRTHPRRLAPSCLLVSLLVVSCTSSDGRDLPESDQFAAGTCREAAPAVIAVDERARAMLEDDVDRAEGRAVLREQQARLQALSQGEDEVALALQRLVGEVGFVRVAVDADALARSEVDEVSDAVDEVVAVCVRGDG